MAYMKFMEYLDRNKKLTNSAPVKVVPDFPGKADAKPAAESKSKPKAGDFGGKGQTSGIKAYKNGTDGKDPNKGKLTDGFASKGDQKLKYTPADTAPAGLGKNSKTVEGVPGGKKSPSWPKTKTQEWVDSTKNMSLAEFTKALRTESIKGLTECACQEAPHNSIKETVSICKCNPKFLSALVREMKRNGVFGKLVKEMVNHPETFKALAILMEHDEMYARRLVKAMNEMVGPPMGDEGGSPMDMGGPPTHHKKKKMPHPDMMGMGDDDDDMGDEGHPDDDNLDMDDTDDMGDDGLSGPEDGDDMGDEGDEGDDMGMDLGDDEDDSGSGGDMEGGGDPNMGDDMGVPMPHDKIGKFPPKKKHAHHHLLGAMKDSGMMGGM